jgi:peptide/nickel transport system substrate-binding protein
MQQVGPEGFNAKPIGAGPYRMVEHQRGSRIVLEAFDKYWGGVPPIKQVTFEIAPEASARVALVESGRAGFASQLPVREVQRLAQKAGLVTKIYPFSEVYMLRIPNYVPPMENDHVRKAMHLSIDTAALSKAFYAGVARPLSVLAPEGTPSNVPDFKFPFDKTKAIAELKEAGFGPDKPVSFTLLSTNGVFPNDYDMARAIAQMWKKVGIDAEIETIEYAKYFELNRASKLPEATLYSWDNASGDPEMFTGYLLHPKRPFSAWKGAEVGDKVMALFDVPDYAKRIEGYREVERFAVEKGANIPLLQSVQSLVHKKSLNYVKYGNGWVLANSMDWT